MAIVTIRASKATPAKVMEYINDVDKAALVCRWNLDPNQDVIEQMRATAKLWGKAQGVNDRKYYHIKISFAPEDWVKNGGTLTEVEALKIGRDLMVEFWPTFEGAGSVHDDKDHLHFHGIINAVNLENGKMLDMRNAEYRRLKDRVQEVCAERGLSTLDWRKATKEKRTREGEPEEAVAHTFAEKGLQERGKAVWKDELRSIVDQAAVSCSSIEEFREALEKKGVILTRCTEQTISYKMGEHRACRGDSLGADYTVEAIRKTLEHNRATPDTQKKLSLDAQISSGTSGGQAITQEERKKYRELGRLAGLKRSEIDNICDHAEKATWTEKQAVWNDYKDASAMFWDEYAIRIQSVRNELRAAHKRRKKVRNAEWALNPRNRHKTLFGVIYALIVFARSDDISRIDREIRILREKEASLRRELAAFKANKGKAVETLRQKDLSLDDYMDSVKRMQDIADDIRIGNKILFDDKQREKLRHQAEKERAKWQKNKTR